MKKINKKGFTLVELLAVIVVLAILATVAITNVLPMMNKARLGTAGDSLISIIKNGFQTCALSTTNASNCKYSTATNASFKLSDYVKYSGDFSTLTSGHSVTQTEISNIKYVENGFTIQVSGTCNMDALVLKLGEIKDSYNSSKTTYQLTCSGSGYKTVSITTP